MDIDKMLEIHRLLIDVDNILVDKFFDLDSDKLLDEKIEVLTKLKNGVPPKDIPNFNDILELMPEDGIWD